MNVMEVIAAGAKTPEPDLDSLLAERNELQAHYEAALPIEAALKSRLQDRIVAIDQEVEVYKGAHFMRNGEGPLPLLSMEVLRWRDGKVKGVPVPRLALVNIKADKVAFASYRPHTNEGVPQGLSNYYSDITLAINRKGIDERFSLWFTYRGAVPSRVKETIAKESAHFDSIHLLVDAPKETWQVRQTRIPRPRVLDPLVVGFRHGGLYLLDQFDPTSVEKYIADEFVTRPQLTS